MRFVDGRGKLQPILGHPTRQLSVLFLQGSGGHSIGNRSLFSICIAGIQLALFCCSAVYLTAIWTGRN
jgi:hypothetical protein